MHICNYIALYGNYSQYDLVFVRKSKTKIMPEGLSIVILKELAKLRITNVAWPALAGRQNHSGLSFLVYGERSYRRSLHTIHQSLARRNIAEQAARYGWVKVK